MSTLLSTLLCLAPSQDVPATLLEGPHQDELARTEAAITAADIEQHVAFLASDELQGRPAASEHTRRAARYLARTLQKSGVQGGAADGSFLQAVPFRLTNWRGVDELRFATADGATVEATNGEEFSVRINGVPTSTGPLRLLHVRAEADVPTTPDGEVALVFHTSATNTREWLESRGAPDGAGWGLIVKVGGEDPGRKSTRPRRGGLAMVAADERDGVEEVTVRGPLIARLEELRTIELTFHVEVEEVDDYNVIGRIDGVGTEARPELAKEVIVFTAHYDHIGTRGEPQDGVDTIYNGADDDASGVAAVLEIAEAFAAEEKAPARTLIFLLATAEERGILGTKWFVQHPPMPLDEIVCNLNFEMLGRPDDLVGAGKLWLTGYERSSLGPAFAAMGLDVVPDARPEQSFFTRSDNIVFVNEGIVGQTLSTYNMHTDYHQVGDEADKLDYTHMQGAVRAGFFASQLLASGQVTPTWNEGEPNVGRRRR